MRCAFRAARQRVTSCRAVARDPAAAQVALPAPDAAALRRGLSAEQSRRSTCCGACQVAAPRRSARLPQRRRRRRLCWRLLALWHPTRPPLRRGGPRSPRREAAITCSALHHPKAVDPAAWGSCAHGASRIVPKLRAAPPPIRANAAAARAWHARSAAHGRTACHARRKSGVGRALRSCAAAHARLSPACAPGRLRGRLVVLA